ncbi:MAG: murein transglycosylase A [Azoarcus sp.]|jgi:membrane-bound lytic murein transglycosylase A|nr:murein transglycosylase A [Azoarcus sp.]
MIQFPRISPLRRLALPALAACAAALVSACTQTVPEADNGTISASVCPATCPPCPPEDSSAFPPVTAPAKAPASWRKAAWEALPGWNDDDPGAAWPAFLASCGILVRQESWRETCAAAAALPVPLADGEARRFFEQRFTPWQSIGGDGEQGLVTGYYEPLIRGSRQRSSATPWPILAPPDDMLTIDLAGAHPELKSMRLRGRLAGNKVVPYWTRGELSERQDKLPARALLWAADPIDLFFLQVQGSGQVELPDGGRVRIGYADQNGHPYRSIGRWLVKQGELSAERASMEGIRQWVRRNPRRLGELLNSNPSYVFFRELPPGDGGPIGALGVPLHAGRSIAVDPAHIPLGAPVFLASTWPLSQKPLERLVMAQDTGSAIKGAVRADFFWGFGPEAGAQAGKMRQQGRMWVLLPNAVTAEEIADKR